MDNFITIQATSGQATTTSVEVARVFERDHKSILRAFNNLQCSEDFNQRNFAPIEYTDNRGRSQTAIEMTKDGFVFLAMGFSKGKAYQFKEAYISEFNRMEDQLRKVSSTPVFTSQMKRVIMNRQKVPTGFFSMIAEAGIRLIYPLELEGVVLPEKLLPDSSLGRGFCKLLREEHNIDTDRLPVYIHTFQDGRSTAAKLYPNEFLPIFLDYFHREWLPQNAEKYFKSRAPDVLSHLPKLLEVA